MSASALKVGCVFALSGVVLLAVSAGRAESMLMEVAQLDLPATVDNQTTFTQINFQQTYNVTPLVFALCTNDGTDPLALRIRNVTTTGFEVAQVEPPDKDGQHAAVYNTAYLAIEPGRARLAPGVYIEAGTHDTTRTVWKNGGGYDTVSFGTPFDSAPAVLADIQTMNNEASEDPGDPPPGGPSTPWLTPSVRNISGSQFELAMDLAETATGTVGSDETIAYLAMTQAAGSFTHLTGEEILFDALISPDVIKGWSDTNPDGIGYEVLFNQAFAQTPLALASTARRDGQDGGWLRRGDLSASSIYLALDEDQFSDDERGHTDEAASIVAFSEPFNVDVLAIPEPATIALFALAGAPLMGALRRRLRRA